MDPLGSGVIPNTNCQLCTYQTKFSDVTAGIWLIFGYTERETDRETDTEVEIVKD